MTFVEEVAGHLPEHDDMELLREALGALTMAKVGEHDVYTYSSGDVHGSDCRLCATLIATIMKLNERLLRE